MIFIAIGQVNAGHGLDIHRANWLVSDNWIGFLIFIVAIMAALLIGLLMRYQEQREIKRISQNYKVLITAHKKI